MAVNQNLVDQLPEFATFLNERGYSVSTDALISFFRLLPETVVSETDLLSMEPYLKPLIVKTEQESNHFHDDILAFLNGDHGENKSKKVSNAKKRYECESDQLIEKRKRLQTRRKEKQDELDALMNQPDMPSQITLSQKKRLGQKRKRAEAEYKKLLKTLKNKSLKQNLLNLDNDAIKKFAPFSKKQLEHMEEALNNLLPMAAFCSNFQSVIDYIKEEISLIRRLQKQETPEKQCDLARVEIQRIDQQLKFNHEEYEQRLRNFQQEIEEINREVFKKNSTEHRSEWKTPHNAVHSTYEGDFEAMTKPFSSLTEKEKFQIQDYIRENTKRFKTKISSNVRTGDRHRLDMAETCKHACATGGIPMKLCYEKPRLDQANLLLVLDVSGSCKEASELMLTFLYYLKDSFPGGCSTFAFVNRLYDISDYLDENNVEDSIKSVLDSIPRKGVYSDYNTPLMELYHTQLSKVNRDTLIIFIGDARNNKNPSGEEYMKALARKSRHTYWFNTEEQELWDKKDSIISTYGQYCKMVGEVLNTQQLVNFLMEVK